MQLPKSSLFNTYNYSLPLNLVIFFYIKVLLYSKKELVSLIFNKNKKLLSVFNILIVIHVTFIPQIMKLYRRIKTWFLTKVLC